MLREHILDCVSPTQHESHHHFSASRCARRISCERLLSHELRYHTNRARRSYYQLQPSVESCPQGQRRSQLVRPCHHVRFLPNLLPDFNINSTEDTLIASSCTSCQIQGDKSAYWTPAFYFAHADGTFEEVPNSGMTIYYLGRGEDGKQWRVSWKDQTND